MSLRGLLTNRRVRGVGLGVALVALLSACNGSFVGSGTIPSAGGIGNATFNFRIVCNTSTNVVTGTLDYSDAGAVGGPLQFSGRATGRQERGVPPFFSVIPDCDTDPTEGQYTGSYGIGAAAGTFEVEIYTSSGVPCLSVYITGGPRAGYYNDGCPTPGSIKSLQFITFPAGHPVVAGVPFWVNPSITEGLPLTVTSATPGICTVSGGVVMPLSVGNCRITASYTGGGLFAADPVSQNFPVSKAATSLSVAPLVAKSALAALAAGQRTAPVTATLSGPGSTVANQLVTFTANGSPLCTATTDWSGVATCSASLTTPAGVRLVAPKTVIAAAYAGSSSLLGSTASTVVS